MSYAHATQGALSNGAAHQDFGDDPLDIRETDHYKQEYVESFVDKWDELIDWEARAESEGGFFIQALKAAASTGFSTSRPAPVFIRCSSCRPAST